MGGDRRLTGLLRHLRVHQAHRTARRTRSQRCRAHQRRAQHRLRRADRASVPERTATCSSSVATPWSCCSAASITHDEPLSPRRGCSDSWRRRSPGHACRRRSLADVVWHGQWHTGLPLARVDPAGLGGCRPGQHGRWPPSRLSAAAGEARIDESPGRGIAASWVDRQADGVVRLRLGRVADRPGAGRIESRDSGRPGRRRRVVARRSSAR